LSFRRLLCPQHHHHHHNHHQFGADTTCQTVAELWTGLSLTLTEEAKQLTSYSELRQSMENLKRIGSISSNVWSVSFACEMYLIPLAQLLYKYAIVNYPLHISAFRPLSGMNFHFWLYMCVCFIRIHTHKCICKRSCADGNKYGRKYNTAWRYECKVDRSNKFINVSWHPQPGWNSKETTPEYK
jgi:hypothetical protein